MKQKLAETETLLHDLEPFLPSLFQDLSLSQIRGELTESLRGVDGRGVCSCKPHI